MIKCNCGYKGRVKTLAKPKRIGGALESEVCPKCNTANYVVHLVNPHIPAEVEQFKAL